VGGPWSLDPPPVSVGVVFSRRRERGGTGRRAGLRILSRKGSGFDSRRSHTLLTYALYPDCVPDDLGGYEIPAPVSLEESIGRVLHLFEKIWLSRYDLYRLLAFWWTGRRLSAPK
jgi:hypothetical protein